MRGQVRVSCNILVKRDTALFLARLITPHLFPDASVLSLDVLEDPEPSDLIDSTPEVHNAGRVDGSRAVSQKLEFLCDARQEWFTSSASRTAIPRD